MITAIVFAALLAAAGITLLIFPFPTPPASADTDPNQLPLF